ncbi:MAG: AtpZ/AtpI family protein [Armatimonadota bacterium]
MKQSRSSLISGAGYWLLAWSVPIAIVIGWGVGWLLDRHFGTEPWLQIVGFVLGAAAGLRQILQLASRDDQ